MKALLLTASLIACSLTASAKQDEIFTCGGSGHGIAFNVQFGGPRYMDSLHIRYIDEELKKLLSTNEQDLKIDNSSISMMLGMGSCQKGAGDTLVTCRLNRDDRGRASIPNLSFRTSQKLGNDFYQSVQVSRNFLVNSLDLVVLKQGTKAVLNLSMNIDTSEKQKLDVQIKKDLGTLEQNWYMCKFISSEDQSIFN